MESFNLEQDKKKEKMAPSVAAEHGGATLNGCDVDKFPEIGGK